jgi:hypothetical protein
MLGIVEVSFAQVHHDVFAVCRRYSSALAFLLYLSLDGSAR